VRFPFLSFLSFLPPNVIFRYVTYPLSNMHKVKDVIVIMPTNVNKIIATVVLI